MFVAPPLLSSFLSILVLGCVVWVGWLLYRLKYLSNHLQETKTLLQQVSFEKEKLSLELDHQAAQFEERLTSFRQHQATFDTQIKALCTDVLQQTQKTFLNQTESLFNQLHHVTRGELGQQHEKLNGLITPVAKALTTMQEKIQTLETSRVGAYEGLTQHLHTLTNTHKDLSQQTHQLVQALRTPHIRGRWGEIQLRRLVELAGMLPHCDFLEQVSLATEEVNRSLRPDLIVTLPGHKKVIIDAKVPLLSYMNGLETTEPQTYQKHMKEHARHMRAHIKHLSQKAYWAQFTPSPEFVLLFLPSENLLIAALEEDKDILDYSAEARVILTTPMTLLALLKTIALGWHQQSFNENAEKICLLGRDIHRRLHGMMTSFSKIGQHLGLTLSHYQTTLQIWEEKVLPSAQELGSLTEIGGASLHKDTSLLNKGTQQRLHSYYHKPDNKKFEKETEAL